MGKLGFILSTVLALALLVLLPLFILGFVSILALGFIVMLLIMLGSVLLFVFWIWMLIDCIRNGKLSANERLIWVIVIVFLNILGAVLYYFLGREKGKKESKPKKQPSKRRK